MALCPPNLSPFYSQLPVQLLSLRNRALPANLNSPTFLHFRTLASLFFIPSDFCEGCRPRQVISCVSNSLRTLCENNRGTPSRHSHIPAIQLLTAVESILTGMHSRKPFRMNTYRKQGGGGSLTRFSSGGLHTASPRFSSRLPARPRTCTLSPATGRNNHDRSA